MDLKTNKIQSSLKPILAFLAFFIGVVASFSESQSNYSEYFSSGFFFGKLLKETRKFITSGLKL